MSHPHQLAMLQAIQEIETQNNIQPTAINYKSLRQPSASLRVNKLDAQVLDGEIMGLLQQPFRNMFSKFEPGVIDSLKPEIDALFSTMLFVFSTGFRRPTPGMKLENVHFPLETLTRRKIGALFLLSIGVPYIWKRLFRHVSMAQWDNANDASSSTTSSRLPHLLTIMKRLETFLLASQLANFLVFLYQGTYRTLAERCLGLELKRVTPTNVPRLINFEYMTRQLIWNGLMEFGNFMLPFLTWKRQRTRAMSQTWPDNASINSFHCGICMMTPPQTPYITSCKHVYCYYCLQTAVATDEDFTCVQCGIKFDSSQRLRA